MKERNINDILTGIDKSLKYYCDKNSCLFFIDNECGLINTSTILMKIKGYKCKIGDQHVCDIANAWCNPDEYIECK